MTNTLHRFGAAESFVDDYIVIAIPAKGAKKAGDPMPSLRKFLQIALEYDPVNIGDAMAGGAFRPTRNKHAIQHFFERSSKPDFQQVIDGTSKPTTYSAVFDKKENAEAFVARIRKENLGLSVNVSSSVENGLGCCKRAGVARHSVGYSLGFEGIADNVPNQQAMMLSTMCGHGMISHALARKMIDWVKENRCTPDEACAALGRFCSCGIFNATRAKRIMRDGRRKPD